MRVGLVLGAGGVTGLAYHAAALAALEHDVGWDPRSADIVVGTSAGSIIAALLRRGIPASDLSAIAVGDEPTHSPEAVVRALHDRQALPPLRLHRIVGRVPRLPSRAILEAWLRRPWRVDPVSAVATVIPDGTLDLVEHAGALDELLGSGWPDEELWICAVRQRDLRRIVLGRDMTAPLSAAVAASCAVPGYFRPVRIGDDAFVDGGVRSPTNADVLRRGAVDLAVIVSPMSGRDLRLISGGALVRRHARNRLEGERRRLAAAGIPSLVVEPGAAVIEVLGTDFMSDTRAEAIVEAARADTAAQLQAPEVQALVAQLTSSRRGRGAGRRRRRRLRAAVRRLRVRLRRRRPVA